jgi:hypothetical protein
VRLEAETRRHCSKEAHGVNAENIAAPWGADWVWGLPLIVTTVMIHVFGLGFIKRRVDRGIRYVWKHQALSIGGITLYIALLLGLEVFIWAVAFERLGALPDRREAMLYSLNALTAFGHTDVTLERRWQLLGALEALNGSILFGLSTAYLFGLVQRIWSHVVSSSRPEF